MRNRTSSHPRKGVFLCAALCFGLSGLVTQAAHSADAPPEIRPGKLASTFEQLRVHEVADQLIPLMNFSVE